MEKKNWLNPEVAEMEVADTQYGGATVTEPDDIFVNAEGKWEATFVES